MNAQMEISVVDRDLPGPMFTMQRRVGDAVGAAFAKWLAQRDLGKFLVIFPPAATVADRFINCVDEAELLHTIAQIMFWMKHYGVAGPLDFHPGGISPDTLDQVQRLKKMVAEFLARESSG
jgi:hypothetical protein